MDELKSFPLTVYGATNCMHTAGVRVYLMDHGIVHEFVNIDEDPDAERFVVFVNGGNRSTPTILFGKSRSKLVLTEPTRQELDDLVAGRLRAA